MKYLSLIKGKITWIVMGLMALTIAILRGNLATEKKERAEEDLEAEKKARKVETKATEALVRGVQNENTKSSDRRSYKFGE